MVFIFNGFWTNLYQGIAQGDLLVPLLNFMDWLPNGPILIYTIFESWNISHILGYIFYGLEFPIENSVVKKTYSETIFYTAFNPVLVKLGTQTQIRTNLYQNFLF